MNFLIRSISARLFVGFGVMLLALLLSAAIGFTSHQSTKADITSRIQAGQKRMSMAQALRESLLRGGIHIRNVGLETEASTMNAEVKAFDAESRKYETTFAELDKLVVDAPGKELLAVIAAARLSTLPFAKEAIGYATAFNSELSVKTLTEKMGPAQEKWLKALDTYVNQEEQAYQGTIAQTLSRSSDASTTMLAVTGVSIGLALIVAVWLTRSIVRPLANAVDVAKAVARMDLTTDVVVTSSDETGQLLEAMRLMNGSLSAVVTQVRTSTTHVADASREIALGNAELANRTEVQAASLEQTSSNMVRLTEAVDGNASKARRADVEAGAAAVTAARAAQTVAEVVATMSQIHSDTRKIEDIIAMIDSIAFQTNILALNAAIEAARAGQLGRGFAVVAGEVRHLAQRSSVASKEIGELIGSSSKRVDAGVILAQSSGQQMNEVVASVHTVSLIIKEISVASGQQASDLNDVATAIRGIDQNTQQNAALVEQAAAAAESLQDQAAALSDAVATFRLSETEVTRMAYSARAAPALPGLALPRKPQLLR